MTEKLYDIIIVGAGYAGLSASYFFKQKGLRHIVFERGRVGEVWRSQHWDSFKLNSTNKLNLLPGMECKNDPDGFDPAFEFVSVLEQYVAEYQLPISEFSKVCSVEKTGEFFKVSVLFNNEVKNYFSRQVLIASGWANEIKIPSVAEDVSPEIRQLHTSQYKNADQLPGGAVLVVGSAQSGIQIAEDLVNAGRKVYLSTSEVGRMPRWYRGRDIFYWLVDLKFYDISESEVTDPGIFTMKAPQITGTGSGRDTVSLQALSKKGATILGRMDDAEENRVFFQSNARYHVKYADKISEEIKKMIDDYISKNNIEAPEAHYDEKDLPDAAAACASDITELNLEENNINTIIWSTGFCADYDYIKLPVFDADGKLSHNNGVTHIPGLYFLGYPWMRSRKSTILFGIAEDVKFITDIICQHAEITNPSDLK